MCKRVLLATFQEQLYKKKKLKNITDNAVFKYIVNYIVEKAYQHVERTP